MLRFGPFTFNPESGELRNGTETVRLTPQIARVLSTLVENQGRVVTRAQLRERVWPDTTVEFDQGLGFCIRQLRIALGDDAASPTYIETLPRRGFRFLAPVLDDSAESPVLRQEPSRPRRRPLALRAIAVVSTIALTVIGLLFVFYRGGGDHPTLLAIVPFDVDSTSPDLIDLRDRIAESVVTRATLRGGRRVGVLGPSTTSTFHWRTLIDTIAMRTGASYALSGIIRKRDGRLRVFAQLIRSSDRAHVWVDRWADSSAAPTGASEFAIAMADSVIWIVMHPNESRPLPK